MKGKITLAAGVGIGYLLGSKKNREQALQQAKELWGNPKVQEQVSHAQDVVREQAPAVKDQLSSAAGKVKDKVGSGSSSSAPAAGAGYATNGPTRAGTPPRPDAVAPPRALPPRRVGGHERVPARAAGPRASTRGRPP